MTSRFASYLICGFCSLTVIVIGLTSCSGVVSSCYASHGAMIELSFQCASYFLDLAMTIVYILIRVAHKPWRVWVLWSSEVTFASIFGLFFLATGLLLTIDLCRVASEDIIPSSVASKFVPIALFDWIAGLGYCVLLHNLLTQRSEYHERARRASSALAGQESQSPSIPEDEGGEA
mmetsp:Transcript_14305/g.29314  ORF Transcript_14305/g.29314 Transcript_14305/m.29314 type:complete len:176 (+) Transcript_14305:787-1314(+)